MEATKIQPELMLLTHMLRLKYRLSLPEISVRKSMTLTEECLASAVDAALSGNAGAEKSVASALAQLIIEQQMPWERFATWPINLEASAMQEAAFFMMGMPPAWCDFSAWQLVSGLGRQAIINALRGEDAW